MHASVPRGVMHDVIVRQQVLPDLRARVAAVVRGLAQHRLDELHHPPALPDDTAWRDRAAMVDVIRRQHIAVAEALLRDL